MRCIGGVFNWLLSLICSHECRSKVVLSDDSWAIYCDICEKRLTKWETP